MPRNVIGGNKAKRGKNIPKTNNRALRTKDSSNDHELYAKVINRAGGNPPIITVKCEDGKERRVVVRGKFTKKVWMNKDDIVLITLNSDSGESGEITVKYSVAEITRLEQIKEITSTTFGVEENKYDILFTNDEIGTTEIDGYFIEDQNDFKKSSIDEENDKENDEENNDSIGIDIDEI